MISVGSCIQISKDALQRDSSAPERFPVKYSIADDAVMQTALYGHQRLTDGFCTLEDVD